MDDINIINLFFERKESAIKETSLKYGKFIRFIAFNITGDETETEECENDTYLKLWNSIPPERPQLLKAYIGTLVRNCALSLYRKNTASKRNCGITVLLDELEECVPSSINTEDEYFGKALTEIINNWLKALSEENRVVFIKRYWYGVPVKDIAAEAFCSPSKISSLLFSLRKQLKNELEKEGVSV